MTKGGEAGIKEPEIKFLVPNEYRWPWYIRTRHYATIFTELTSHIMLVMNGVEEKLRLLFLSRLLDGWLPLAKGVL